MTAKIIDGKAVAADIQANHPEMAEPLIRRWTGAAQQFAKV